MMKLERMINIMRRGYNGICVNGDRIVASVSDFEGAEKHHYHLLDSDGGIVRGLGRKYSQAMPKSLGLHFGGGGDFNTLSLLLLPVLGPVSFIYDTITAPTARAYSKGLAKKADSLFEPSGICIADDAIYAIDRMRLDRAATGFWHEGMNTAHIAVFDREGRGAAKHDIKETLDCNLREPRPLQIRSVDDRLIVLAGLREQSILEFDKEGNYAGMIASDISVYPREFDAGEMGIYGVERRRDDKGYSMLRIGWDGKKESFPIGQAGEVVLGNDRLYMAQTDRILTYSGDMDLLSEDIIEAPEGSGINSLAYDDGRLYALMGDIESSYAGIHVFRPD